MSKNKVGEAAEVVARSGENPVFTTNMPPLPKDGHRGPNTTLKSAMHIGRDWSEASWRQAWRSYCKKLDREAYMKRSETK